MMLHICPRPKVALLRNTPVKRYSLSKLDVHVLLPKSCPIDFNVKIHTSATGEHPNLVIQLLNLLARRGPVVLQP